RLANVAGAFAMRNAECGMGNDGRSLNFAFRIPNSALILVDDVFTTGATLAEAARALEQGGARTVLGVTFGRATLPDFTGGARMPVRVAFTGFGGSGRTWLRAAVLM